MEVEDAEPPIEGLQCTTRGLWEDLSQQLFDFLGDITLQGLVDRGKQRIVPVERPAVTGLGQRAA